MRKLKNFLLHVLSIFLIILALGAFSFSAFSGILVLLSGMLCSPLLRRVIEKRLGKKLKGIVLYIGAAVLFLTGIMSTPTSDSSDLGKEVLAESTVDLSELEETIASPTPTPTWKPTASPVASPTKEPAVLPTQAPTKAPIATPMLSPTKTPAQEPTVRPTEEPIVKPTVKPTEEPTAEPALPPTMEPSAPPAQASVQQPAEPAVQNPADLQTQTVTNDTGISAQQESAEAPQSEISSGSATGVTGGDNFGDAIAQGGYIGNRNNHKLHRSTCKTLPKESNQVYFSTREEAVNAGYSDPCKNCNP